MSETGMKSITIAGKQYHGWLVHSPDDGGYYVEMWQETGRPVQTDVFKTPEEAWKAAKHIIILENRR